MLLKPFYIGLLVLICFFAMLRAEAAPSSEEPIYKSEEASFKLETLAQQKDIIWGFDFFKDGRIIFTERSGALRIYSPKTKKVTSISGVPQVAAEGQGGLLDVRVHPTIDNRIYLTYSEPKGDKATTAIAMANLDGNKLTQFKKILSARAPSENEIHYGSRIEFDGKGYIYVTIGERNMRDEVQDLSYHLGKILRLKDDGSVPADNPFVKQKDAQPEIWAYGIRSPQGIVRDTTTGDIWMSEMGPQGGDELNLLKRGANYGWPVITYGKEYWGPKIGEGTQKPGMEQPVAYWAPSISPSGIAFYNGNAFPKWKGNLFLATLSGQHLRRIVIKDQKIAKQEVLLEDKNWRFRNVRTGHDGLLYFSTDNGKLVRLEPVKSQ